MKKFNKLVRDKIPEILLKDHALPVTRILNDDEYISELNTKLKKEIDKYFETQNIEEMIDILEVIRAILEFNNISYQDLEDKRIKKAQKRGTFKNRIYLEKIIENGD